MRAREEDSEKIRWHTRCSTPPRRKQITNKTRISYRHPLYTPSLSPARLGAVHCRSLFLIRLTPQPWVSREAFLCCRLR